jgi:flagellar hook assembly protein FlgD
MSKTAKLLSLLACLFACAAFPLFSQNETLSLYSPVLLSSGASAASLASPQADATNPAASGGTQRITADLSYIGLLGLGGASGFGGSLNAGLTFPTPFAVIAGSARFLSTPPSFGPLSMGSLGAFNFSLAKDLLPSLFVGAGIAFQIGSDWGLGLDLGLMHFPGDIGFLKDFRWGAALRGIGKGYPSPSGAAGMGAIPPVFTPGIGASASLIKTDQFVFSLVPDLSFPSFQDLRIVLGLSLSISDYIFINGSYTYDLKDAANGKAPQIPIALGASVKLPTDIIKEKSDLLVSSAVAPLQNGVWGLGLGANLALGPIDRTPPRIEADIPTPAYISPGTASPQAALIVPLTITDERYVKGYRLIVKDQQGQAILTMSVSDEGPAITGFQGFIDRLLLTKKSMAVPPSISWDGKDDAGAGAPDGSYSWIVEAWDDNGNLARTDPKTVIVDTVAPSVSVSAPYLEFSPSGEGTKGSLVIQQSGSVEDLWVGTITDAAGKEVRQFRWTNDSPKKFEWRGRDSGGKLAPDGTYTYTIASTDRAGNTGSAVLEGIIINTQATPISLSTDIPAFSPNGDGIKDEITLVPEVKVTAGIEKWTLTIRDSAGAGRRTFTGDEVTPPSIMFDGRDDDGALLPDGYYRGSLNVVYRNGHTPTADSADFLLRVTPPSAEVIARYKEFSPDGVGRKTTLPVDQTGSEEILWEGFIANADGRTVKSMRWDEKAPKGFIWDGRDDEGKIVPDGTYVYRLACTDPAGNSISVSLDGIVVNTVPTPASLSIDLAAFSPNGDGNKDSLRFTLNVPVTEGIEKWTLVVNGADKKSKRRFTGDSMIPEIIAFDGRDDVGTMLPEGTYSAALSLTYANGHEPSADSPPFIIDVTQPQATARSDYAVFSPVGEGTRNLLTFSQQVTKDASWEGIVRDKRGNSLRTSSWKDRPDPKFVFDGRGDDGKLLPDGKYTYTLEGMDRAGNTGKSQAVAFEIDTTATPVIVSTDLTWFSPGGAKPIITIIPSLKVTTGVDTFELRIKNDKGIVVRKMSGKNAAPGDFLWDGLDDAKTKVPDGQYIAELDMLYRNGNHPVARTNPFFIDTGYPSATVSADALLFSPSPDSSLTSIAIRQTTSNEDLWQGQFQDSTGKTVRAYSWKGKAADFSWDGKDDNGNTVPDGLYRYSVSATRKAGNKTVKSLEGIRVDTRPTPVSVNARSDGLSPNGDGFRDTIGFNLSVGLADGIKAWKLSMVSDAGGVQKMFAGSPPVPETIFWDGKTEAGKVVEGTYAAQLDVEYTKGNRPSAKSASFLLSVTPPKIEVEAKPVPFAPSGEEMTDTMTIALKVSGASPVDTWDAAILDPENHPFNSFSGKGAPEEAITWDGLSANGELVESAQDYILVTTVKDLLGNVATLKTILPIDVLVIRDGNRLKVRVTSITFAPNTADYINVPTDRADKNMNTLKRLAQIFKKYAQYKIRIEGHAVMINWDKPAEGQKEQVAVLIPLSKSRAEAVKSALGKLGIDAKRITTEGIGGAAPIVPFSDLENRWKNRRVEFILVKE